MEYGMGSGRPKVGEVLLAPSTRQALAALCAGPATLDAARQRAEERPQPCLTTAPHAPARRPPRAPLAPTYPGASPQQRGGSRRPPLLASGRLQR